MASRCIENKRKYFKSIHYEVYTKNWPRLDNEFPKTTNYGLLVLAENSSTFTRKNKADATRNIPKYLYNIVLNCRLFICSYVILQ